MSGRDPFISVVARLANADGGGEVTVERVESTEYTDSEEKSDRCKLVVDNFDLRHFDAATFRTGNQLEVTWGYAGNMAPPRLLTIQKTTGSTKLIIEAKDAGVLMNKMKRSRSFDRKKRSDVARQIAEENGYGPDRQQIDDSAEVLETVTQARLTDAQLLRDMARREGFVFFIDVDGFHFHQRKLGQAPVRELVYYLDGTGTILSFNVDNDIYAGKAGGVTLSGRDPLTKEDFSALGDNASAKDQTSLASERVIITGISERDGAVTGDRVQESGSEHVAATTEATAASAERSAAGAYAANQLGAVVITCECRGDPALLAKTVARLVFPGAKRITGNYYVKEITHKVSRSGYTMTLKATRQGFSGSGGGVPAAGPQNDAEAPPQATENGGDLFARVDERSGEVSFVPSGGRTNDDAPKGQP